MRGGGLAWTLPAAGDQSAAPTFMATLLSMVAAYSVAADFCTTTCNSAPKCAARAWRTPWREAAPLVPALPTTHASAGSRGA